MNDTIAATRGRFSALSDSEKLRLLTNTMLELTSVAERITEERLPPAMAVQQMQRINETQHQVCNLLVRYLRKRAGRGAGGPTDIAVLWSAGCAGEELGPVFEQAFRQLEESR